ncbi:hypothetical protein C8J57DRAFT_593741 [Mycena rebaudengoi]|nr:hypothetical protein C8J57DRAFT_593741 [Mycena rebaudengoi]
MLRTTTRAVLVRRAPFVLQSRPSSSAAHDDHAHEVDDTVYPKEGFGAPIWRRTLLCVAGGIAFYELMGAPNDNQGWLPSLGRIAPSKDWTDIAARRAVEAASLGEQTQFFKTATRPPIYRSRAPESFYSVSPYGNPVGMSVQWDTTPPPPLPESAEKEKLETMKRILSSSK